MKENYLFTSESVSSGHPDKLADQISDAILDEFLRQDRESKVACETFITDGLVLVGGEVHSTAYVDIKQTIKGVLNNVGYTPNFCFDPDNFGLISTIHEQSPDIRQGVDNEEESEQGAGDQGIMFGYACNETSVFMPVPIVLSHVTMQVMDDLRHRYYSECAINPSSNIGPDAKCQYTVEYDGYSRKPLKIKTILISTQHNDYMTQDMVRDYVVENVIPEVKMRCPSLNYLFDTDYDLLVNPTGQFIIGGPKGDTGLTGRKIIVDTYGGSCPHGGGAFSGKDPSKVDRSAAYMARYIAKNIVASGLANEATVQLSYAIGKAEPLSVYVNTNGTGKYDDATLANAVREVVDLRPAAIIRRFGLKNPIYLPTATYGHFGREPFIENGIKFFGWEEIDKNFKEKIKLAIETNDDVDITSWFRNEYRKGTITKDVMERGIALVEELDLEFDDDFGFR